MWNVPKCTDNICSGLNETKVTVVGGSNNKIDFASLKNWVRHQNRPFLVLCTFQTSDSPVALPRVSDVGVVYVVFVGLLVQEVKHVFDGQWQGAASVGCAEDGFKQIVHKLLQRALRVARSKMDRFKPQKCKEVNNWAFTEYGKTYSELKPTKEKKWVKIFSLWPV